MPDVRKVCRVCGGEYVACRSLMRTGEFRWQDVACSPECGTEYLRRVMEARKVVEQEVQTEVDAECVDEECEFADEEDESDDDWDLDE